MPDHNLLGNLILVYTVALAFILVLARLKVPPIVAMILAGVVAGPSGLAFVGTQDDVELLAEIGVVLLLFTVGLEFSLTEMRKIWRTVIGGGLLQIAGTTVVVGVLASTVLGVTRADALFLGLFVALSSTAIVLKGLGERNELGTPAGRLMTGVLLFQDLAIIPLMLIIPLLSGRTTFAAVPRVLLGALAALLAVAVVSRLLLPALLRIVSRSGRREAFPLAILLASVGTAWLSSLFGVSMALGAFLGGLVLAESEFSHQAYAEIRPLRDVLAGLFFVSLGMLADPMTIARALPIVALVTVVILLVKNGAATASFLAVGNPLRIALIGGIGLAQVGEFSFILGREGLASGLLTAETWQILLAASILTMMLTPTLLATAPDLAGWLTGLLRASSPTGVEGSIPDLAEHVVILGYGLGGELVARGLREIGVPYLILELNGATVRRARLDGEPIFYGDATSPDSLRAAGVGHARGLVVVLSDPTASLRSVKVVRDLSPAVPIVVRARYRFEAEKMMAAGATVAVAEEMETSLEVVAQLFSRLHVPGNLVDALLETYRRESATRRPVQAARVPFEAIPREIRGAPVTTYQLAGADWAVGRTLADINLRAETGASVLAVKNETRYLVSPPADFELGPGDVLYLLGDDSDILLARQRLTSGP